MWAANISYALKTFIVYQIGFLWLKNELSKHAIDVLLCSTLILKNAAFRKLIGLEPLIEDEEDWDDRGRPIAHASISARRTPDREPAVVPQQAYQQASVTVDEDDWDDIEPAHQQAPVATRPILHTHQYRPAVRLTESLLLSRSRLINRRP